MSARGGPVLYIRGAPGGGGIPALIAPPGGIMVGGGMPPGGGIPGLIAPPGGIVVGGGMPPGGGMLPSGTCGGRAPGRGGIACADMVLGGG